MKKPSLGKNRVSCQTMMPFVPIKWPLVGFRVLCTCCLDRAQIIIDSVTSLVPEDITGTCTYCRSLNDAFFL